MVSYVFGGGKGGTTEAAVCGAMQFNSCIALV